MNTTCTWPGSDELMIDYHDNEWGVPLHDDQKLFEFMVLDAFQAGLSWRTILHRREGFRVAFANFDAKRISQFTDEDIEQLMNNAAIIRNRQKLISTIKNAELFLAVQKEFGSFDAFIWQFVGGQPIVNYPQTDQDIPAVTPEAEAMSKSLRARGFRFVGPTICYAFMQASGLVNDHIADCLFKNK